MTSDAKWIIGTLGGGLGALVVVGHALLADRIDRLDERLGAVEMRLKGVEVQLGLPPLQRPLSSVPDATDGITTYASVSTGRIEVQAPDGTVLTGSLEADLIVGLLVVTSDDASRGRVTQEIDPRDFRDFGNVSTDLTNLMLLELHGWPPSNWPEGWTP